ncbi:MAG: hypothetical protein AVDCRST_MAG39-499, partial [uncultured Sphingomonadaceae bacterium]
RRRRRRPARRLWCGRAARSGRARAPGRLPPARPRAGSAPRSRAPRARLRRSSALGQPLARRPALRLAWAPRPLRLHLPRAALLRPVRLRLRLPTLLDRLPARARLLWPALLDRRSLRVPAAGRLRAVPLGSLLRRRVAHRHLQWAGGRRGVRLLLV